MASLLSALLLGTICCSWAAVEAEATPVSLTEGASAVQQRAHGVHLDGEWSDFRALDSPKARVRRSLMQAEGEAVEKEESGGVKREGKLLMDTAVGTGSTAAGGGGAVEEEATASGKAEGKKKTGMVDALISSFSMILVTEIGDETFIIAALMAMRHSRSIVLAGALSALGIMTVLSTGLGLIVPSLISRKATNHAAAVLYTFFGLRLLYIAWKADPNDTPQKEMEEVEEKLEDDEKDKGRARAFRKFLGRFCTPIFLEAFILTFLAEWGDRSQIATIALASHKNAIGVTVGATLGHVVCTSLAVVGGRILALRISQRTVATIGGLLFLVFAVHSYVSPVDD